MPKADNARINELCDIIEDAMKPKAKADVKEAAAEAIAELRLLTS